LRITLSTKRPLPIATLEELMKWKIHPPRDRVDRGGIVKITARFVYDKMGKRPEKGDVLALSRSSPARVSAARDPGVENV
jgi:hypothetical protein